MAQHEHRPLTAFQSIDRRRHAGAPFASEQTCFRIGIRCCMGTVRCERAAVVSCSCRDGVIGRYDPAIAANARLAAIKTAVDENSCKPDLERPRFAVRTDVAEHLDEGVLNGFVGIRGVAQILERNPQRAPLVCGDEAFETLSSLIHFPAFDQFSNFDRKT
jgi:hypothetical protein